MEERKEVTLTVGVTAGILHKDGKLLIQRRKERGSVIAGKTFLGDYEVPGGSLKQEEREQLLKALAIEKFWKEQAWMRKGIEEVLHIPSVREVLGVVLQREVEEEEGLELSLRQHNLLYKGAEGLYRTILVQKAVGKIDISICVPVLPDEWRGVPTGEIEWASPERIRELAHKPKGEQIVSGWGKRMCQAMLWYLTFSLNPDYREEARIYLREILRGLPGKPYPYLETVNII